jgi:hypothetical protein
LSKTPYFQINAESQTVNKANSGEMNFQEENSCWEDSDTVECKNCNEGAIWFKHEKGQVCANCNVLKPRIPQNDENSSIVANTKVSTEFSGKHVLGLLSFRKVNIALTSP